MTFNFGITEQALTLRAKRATLIANNIANSDTPGYKATDLDFRQILGAQAQARGTNLPGDGPSDLKKTHPSHFDSMGFGNDLMLDQNSPQYRIIAQPSLDGNTVDTQQEKAAFAENQLRYQASVQFLDDKVRGLQKAFRGS